MRRIFAESLGAALGAIVLAAVIIATPAPAEASTCSLTTTTGAANWSDTTKWTGCGGTYPGASAGDTADVSTSLVNVNVDVVIANGVNLQLNAAKVNVAIPSGSALQIEASSSSTSANSSQSLSLNKGAHLELQNESQLNITVSDPIQTNDIGGPAIDIFSGGAMSKTTSTGTTQIVAAVNNGGSVTVTTGRLNLYGGGHADTEWNVCASAVKRFGVATHHLVSQITTPRGIEP
jgi:hypothetical protein